MSRLRSIGSWSLLNALWAPIAFQDAALLTIAVPAVILKLAPDQHVAALSALSALAALAAMLVPPFAGGLSDKLRRRGGLRKAFVAGGLAIDVAALAGVAYANNLPMFCALFVLAIVGTNVAQSAYQALLPEAIPRAQWGAVSSVRGIASLIGTILGLGIAGWAPEPRLTFLATAAFVLLASLTLFFIHEGPWQEPDRAHVRNWHDFMVVFNARVLVFFGLVLLQTFVLYYFRDVQHIADPSASTAFVAFGTMLGAIGSNIVCGILSDRLPKKLVTSVAGIPMAVAAIGFAVFPDPKAMFLFGILFGVGFGGVFSSGWALAMDSIPTLTDVARDLGLWGIATNLPNLVAPLVGGWLIWIFGGTKAGYQAVFALAGLSFALGSLTVLRVGYAPLSSFWGWLPRMAAVSTNYIYDRLANRVRRFGNLPRRRGSTLIVANHQHDLESMTIVSAASLHASWRHPVFTACSRRMYEPGFLAVRIPWLRWALRRYNSAGLFVTIGMLPLENELRSRAVGALAYSVQKRHGVLPLTAVFDDAVASQFTPGTTTDALWSNANFDAAQQPVKLSTLREPYRSEVLAETRANIESDLALMESVVRRGGTFYLTPEGQYTVDGRIGPMRGAIDRLAPIATIYLAGVSYDVFAPGRLSMLYRIERLDDREHLAQTLAAIRPITLSQVLASFLDQRDGAFTGQDATAAVEQRLSALPPWLLVDPELRRDPARMTSRAIVQLVRRGTLIALDGRYQLAQRRYDARFPHVPDMVAFQARMFDETLANAAYAPGAPARQAVSA